MVHLVVVGRKNLVRILNRAGTFHEGNIIRIIDISVVSDLKRTGGGVEGDSSPEIGGPRQSCGLHREHSAHSAATNAPHLSSYPIQPLRKKRNALRPPAELWEMFLERNRRGPC